MTLEHSLQELAQSDGSPKHILLVQLSGLNDQEFEQFRSWWPSISSEHRQKLMGLLVSVAEDNVDLDFNPIFRHCLSDDNPDVRDRAVSGLWECDDRSLVTPLMTLLREDPYEHVRASAATALGKFATLAEAGKLLSRHGERIKEFLLSVLKNEQESIDVRRRVLEAVACFNTPEIRSFIDWAYDSSDSKLHISALYAMGRTCDPDWLPVLTAATEDKDPGIRYEAASACAEMGEEKAVHYLIPLIRDDDPQVQTAAVRALGAIGGPLAERALKQCLVSDDEVLQNAAEEAVQQLEAEHDPINFKLPRYGP
ncbi:MAG: HEAT repeat domain-containing protein [Dehalococcoidia bacterium]